MPVLGGDPGAAVGPPILSGHGLDGPGQIVLGAVTLGQLGKKVGDTVVVDNGATAPTRLQVVGTATMPTIGEAREDSIWRWGAGRWSPPSSFPRRLETPSPIRSPDPKSSWCG